MYETVKFNIFEENLEEIVYGNKVENQPSSVEMTPPSTVRKDERTSLLTPIRNYNQPVFRRLDREREVIPNTRQIGEN